QQRPVLRGQGVGLVLEQAVGGEGGAFGERVVGQAVLRAQVGAHVGAFALHEVAGQQSAARVGVQVGVGECGVEQAQQVAERRLLAAVRGGGHQDQVAFGVGGDALEEFVAQLVLPGAGVVGGHAGVRLVHDDQVGAVADEVV